MLLFAIFTAGYLFGVFLTLGVFLKKEAVEEVSSLKTVDAEEFKSMDSWEVFERLTKVTETTTERDRSQQILQKGLLAAAD